MHDVILRDIILRDVMISCTLLRLDIHLEESSRLRITIDVEAWHLFINYGCILKIKWHIIASMLIIIKAYNCIIVTLKKGNMHVRL